MDNETGLIARRTRALAPTYRLFYREPLHIVRGDGAWLYAADGTRYLDAYNNVVAVGHCHPRITAALTRQASQLNTHTRYLHSGILDYADRLLATFPPELSQLVLTCSGSEANDLALRISKAFTHRTGFIVTECAYHGVTDAVAQLSPSLGPGVPMVAHVRRVPAPNSFRGGTAVGETFAHNVRCAIAELEATGIGIAALVCDSVFSSDGVFTHPSGFLKSAVDAVKKAGGLFIADEVQAGFGRTGESMWGFARHAIEPDIVTLGKPMGNGHPIAGAVMSQRVVAEFGRKMRYFNTYAGNPVSCAVALATLEVIQKDGLQANAERVGSYLSDGLRGLAHTYPAIGDVRGAGLSIGVEIVNTETGQPDSQLADDIVNGLCKHHHVLISATGPRTNVLKIRPPLVFAEEHAERLVTALQATLQLLIR